MFWVKQPINHVDQTDKNLIYFNKKKERAFVNAPSSDSCWKPSHQLCLPRWGSLSFLISQLLFLKCPAVTFLTKTVTDCQVVFSSTENTSNWACYLSFLTQLIPLLQSWALASWAQASCRAKLIYEIFNENWVTLNKKVFVINVQLKCSSRSEELWIWCLPMYLCHSANKINTIITLFHTSKWYIDR